LGDGDLLRIRGSFGTASPSASGSSGMPAIMNSIAVVAAGDERLLAVPPSAASDR
jgi:hypothetical protein